MEFGDAADNLVFRIKACCGKQVGLFSAFPDEDEVLLLPGAQFVVASAPYGGAPHGCTFVDLDEVLPGRVQLPRGRPETRAAPPQAAPRGAARRAPTNVQPSFFGSLVVVVLWEQNA